MYWKRAKVTTEKAEKGQGGGISAIWIIPLLALALGAYMVVHTWMTEGPEITITFATAEGSLRAKPRSNSKTSIWAWWKKSA